MKKDLPNVFANPIEKDLKNNNDVFYSNDFRNYKQENIPEKINKIFADVHHVYKSKVKIKTNKGEINTTIVGKSGNYLLTLNGDKINIIDILNIERI